MAVEERAAPAVLAREPDRITFVEERRVGEAFGHPPVERKLAFHHEATVFHDLLHPRMELEVVGYGCNARAQLLQRLEREPRVLLLVPLAALVAAPVDLERRLVVGQDRLVRVEPAVERLAE